MPPVFRHIFRGILGHIQYRAEGMSFYMPIIVTGLGKSLPPEVERETSAF